MDDITGPVGFQHIESAPRDGTFVRLRFRPSELKGDPEEVGRWVEDKTMKAGGWWMDREGYYVSGPLFWARRNNGEEHYAKSVDRDPCGRRKWQWTPSLGGRS